MNLETIYIDIKVKLGDLEKQLKELNNKVAASSKEASSTFERGWLSKLGKVAVGVGVLKASFDFLNQSIQEYIKQAQAEWMVEKALVNTKRAAEMTLDELKKIASEVQQSSKYGDDYFLQNVTLQLLRFSNISGDVFKRTQQAALDVAAVMDGDLKGATVMLGRALENPLRGMTLLRRQGIEFNTEQQNHIATLVKQNKVQEAQAYILSVIESKYKGQAKAQSEAAGGLYQLSNAWGDLKESVGQLFAPLLNSWLPALDRAVRGWTYLLQGSREKPVFTMEQREVFVESLSKTTKEERLKMQGQYELKISENEAFLKLKNLTEDQIRQANAELVVYKGYVDVLKNYETIMQNRRQRSKNQFYDEDELRKQKELEEKKKQERENLERELYETLKFYSKNYMDYQLNILKETESEMRKAGLNEVDIAAFVAKRKIELHSEYLDFVENSKPPTIIDEDELRESLKKAEEEIFALADEFSERLTREGIEITEMQKRIFDDRLSALREFASSLQVVLKNEDTVLYKLMQITQVATNFVRIMSEWKERDAVVSFLQVFSNIFALVGLFAHSGGIFYGGAKVQGFAQGGSFIVPSGYPNDSYPIRVETNELVEVTPSHLVKTRLAMDRMILDALNKRSESHVRLYGRLQGRDIYLSNNAYNNLKKAYL